MNSSPHVLVSGLVSVLEIVGVRIIPIPVVRARYTFINCLNMEISKRMKRDHVTYMHFHHSPCESNPNPWSETRQIVDRWLTSNIDIGVTIQACKEETQVNKKIRVTCFSPRMKVT